MPRSKGVAMAGTDDRRGEGSPPDAEAAPRDEGGQRPEDDLAEDADAPGAGIVRDHEPAEPNEPG